MAERYDVRGSNIIVYGGAVVHNDQAIVATVHDNRLIYEICDYLNNRKNANGQKT
jgi:hypothetical protein